MAKPVKIPAPTGMELLLGFARLLEDPASVLTHIERCESVLADTNEKLERLGILEDANKVMRLAEAKNEEAERRLGTIEDAEDELQRRIKAVEKALQEQNEEQNKTWGKRWADVKSKEAGFEAREKAIAEREAVIESLKDQAESAKGDAEQLRADLKERLKRMQDAAGL